jgi:hypothetical protein
MRAAKTLSLAILVASATTMLGAQQTKASTQPAKPVSPTPPASAQAPVQADANKPAIPPQETYQYDPGGRRDPFLNLIGVGTERAGAKKGDGGPAGMSVTEISVRGIMQSHGKLVAMVMGPDNKTYIVNQADKLSDGSIRLITPQGLVVDQEINDPLSVVKQREIRKLLRGLEDAK